MLRFEHSEWATNDICGALIPFAEAAALAGNKPALRRMLSISCYFHNNSSGAHRQLQKDCSFFLKLLQIGSLYATPEQIEAQEEKLIPIAVENYIQSVRTISHCMSSYIEPLKTGNLASGKTERDLKYDEEEYRTLENLCSELKWLLFMYEGESVVWKELVWAEEELAKMKERAKEVWEQK